MRRSLISYRRKISAELRNLRSKDPKEYWNRINPRKKEKRANISLDSLFEHFRKLNKGGAEDNNQNSENVEDKTTEFNEILDEPITDNEIRRVFSKLKNSPGTIISP